MSIRNQILAAVHEHLKGRGYESRLNILARVGVPCAGGTPNVTVGRCVGIQVHGNNLVVFSTLVPGAIPVEIAHPDMFDRLEAAVAAAMAPLEDDDSP